MGADYELDFETTAKYAQYLCDSCDDLDGWGDTIYRLNREYSVRRLAGSRRPDADADVSAAPAPPPKRRPSSSGDLLYGDR